ncbi:MAG: hypothetical protein EBX52_03485 [Proteobacteria bacterium]|nr:hypothetical protein [Pseudomonadota bacterium]
MLLFFEGSGRSVAALGSQGADQERIGSHMNQKKWIGVAGIISVLFGCPSRAGSDETTQDLAGNQFKAAKSVKQDLNNARDEYQTSVSDYFFTGYEQNYFLKQYQDAVKKSEAISVAADKMVADAAKLTNNDAQDRLTRKAATLRQDQESALLEGKRNLDALSGKTSGDSKEYLDKLSGLLRDRAALVKTPSAEKMAEWIKKDQGAQNPPYSSKYPVAFYALQGSSKIANRDARVLKDYKNKKKFLGITWSNPNKRVLSKTNETGLIKSEVLKLDKDGDQKAQARFNTTYFSDSDVNMASSFGNPRAEYEKRIYPPASASTVTPAPATQTTTYTLVFTTQPGDGTAGAALSDQPVVTIQDQIGNTVSDFNGSVTISIAENPGSGALGGGITVNAVNGVATFKDLSVDKKGSGYTLTASGNGLTATSSAFDVAAAPPPPPAAGSGECDEVYGNIAKAIVGSKDGPAVYAKMVDLAELKMAYRLAKDNDPYEQRSLESYLNRAKDLKDQIVGSPVSEDLNKVYQKYGVANAGELIKGISDKISAKKYSYSSKGMVDNQTVGALMLYLATNEKDDIPEAVKFTESDAASVWALGEIRKRNFKEGDTSGNSNLLKFTVRLCHKYPSKACAGKDNPDFKVAKMDADAIAKSADASNKALAAQVNASLGDYRTQNPSCFEKCSTNADPLNNQDVKRVLAKLNQLISTDAKNKDGPGVLNLDFKKMKITKDTIEFGNKPVSK